MLAGAKMSRLQNNALQPGVLRAHWAFRDCHPRRGFKTAGWGRRAAMGQLTTHVLDTAAGLPAAGIHVELFRLAKSGGDKLAEARTNADGRLGWPILEGDEYKSGTYELVFHVGAYFKKTHSDVGTFLNTVPVRFVLDENEDHYHVPLLISPFGYTTYRGS